MRQDNTSPFFLNLHIGRMKDGLIMVERNSGKLNIFLLIIQRSF